MSEVTVKAVLGKYKHKCIYEINNNWLFLVDLKTVGTPHDLIDFFILEAGLSLCSMGTVTHDRCQTSFSFSL